MRDLTRIIVSIIGVIATMSTTLPQAQAAGAEDDGSTNPMYQLFQMHYVNRVNAFKSENNNLSNVVLLGDSITEGFDTSKWFPFRRVINRGIGSDVIGVGQRPGDKRGVLKRMDASVFDCATSHVFLMIGINDLGDNRPIDMMVQGYDQILSQIKTRTPAVTVHVESLLPTRGGFAKHNANVRKINEELQKLAAKHEYRYLDLHAQFIDEKGELRKELTGDGLHINDAGYAIWKEQIEKEMNW